MEYIDYLIHWEHQLATLIKNLKHRRDITNTLEILGELGPSAELAIPAILELIENVLDEDIDTLKIAVSTLGKIYREGTRIRPASQDPGFIITEQSRKDSPSVKSTLAVLNNLLEVSQIRVEIVKTLGAIGPEAAAFIPLLLKNIREFDEESTEIALCSIANIDIQFTMDFLAKEIIHGENLSRKVSSKVFVMIANVSSVANDVLIRLINHESLQVKIAIIEALSDQEFFDLRKYAEISKEEQNQRIFAITATLKTKNKRLQSKSLQTLGKMGAKAAYTLHDIVEVLSAKNTDIDIQYYGFEALHYLQEKNLQPVVPLALKALETGNIRLQKCVLGILCETKTNLQSLVPVLTRMLQSREYGVRRRVFYILGNMGILAKSAIPALIELLQDIKQAKRKVRIIEVTQVLDKIFFERKWKKWRVFFWILEKDRNKRIYSRTAIWPMIYNSIILIFLTFVLLILIVLVLVCGLIFVWFAGKFLVRFAWTFLFLGIVSSLCYLFNLGGLKTKLEQRSNYPPGLTRELIPQPSLILSIAIFLFTLASVILLNEPEIFLGTTTLVYIGWNYCLYPWNCKKWLLKYMNCKAYQAHYSAENAKKIFANSMKNCSCGNPPEQMRWFYYNSLTKSKYSYTAGWVIFCKDCQKFVDYTINYSILYSSK